MSRYTPRIEKILSHKNCICILSSVGPTNIPNSALFGAVKIVDEEILIAMGDNRTYANLLVNPHAALMLIIPADSAVFYRGLRLDLHLIGIAEESETFATFVAEVSQRVGKTAAASIRRIVRFALGNVRPLAGYL